ncbi:MAG: DUF58 domain-containing protein [Betaproteobacteria bacterium]|nr:DUF58 domain-containing protein [Betaproteobacteria bacterium]
MIVPDLPELIALRGAAQGLALQARRPVLTRLHGSHRTPLRGRGLEFEEVRPYAAGDDARYIDWRVTARRGRPHTKLFREERERPVWMIADMHPGLFFGSRRQLKSALLVRAAALLGWVAILGGDRLGAVLPAGPEGAGVLPPRGREAGLLPILESLVAAQPRAPGPPETGLLDALLARVRPLVQPGSTILVASDFAGLDASSENRLSALAVHNDCRLVRIADPLEQNGLPAGTYRAGVPGRLRWLDGDRTRSAWRQTWNDREARLDALSVRGGMPVVRLSTADAVTDVLPTLFGVHGRAA